ncbi:MAG: CapA family protein [Sphingomonadaceae bacterium]|nr:CapA family protein [Sphingomonadaceae bacterium]
MSYLSIIATGDLILDVADADHWLAAIAPLLHAADLSIGHLEVPHSWSAHEMAGDVPAPAAPPGNVAAIGRAGFGAVTLAGNHIADCGEQGIADTLALLDAEGIGHCGAGRDAGSAFAPLVVEVGAATRVGLLSYNCVGPEAAWAQEHRAGCAYLRIAASDGGPIAPTSQLDTVTEEALARLAQDIAALRAEADLVIVALHKGIVHTPARLAPYERQLGRAAIASGADAVISHHAHIARGIEFVDGKPIFHGLGNGCVVTHALSPAQDHPLRAAWAEKRRRLFGFEPDPAYHLAPFHPEAVNAFMARLDIGPDGKLETRIEPVDVVAPGRPEPASGARAESIRRYVEKITVEAGLPPIRIDSDNRVSPAL